MRSTAKHKQMALLVTSIAILAAACVSAAPPPACHPTGIQVHCFVRGAPLKPAEPRNLDCRPAHGPRFVDDQKVPLGWRFGVTDIVVTPDGGTDAAAITHVVLYDAYELSGGQMGRATGITLRGTTTATYGISQTTPYLMLPEGHWLEVVVAAWSQKWAEVHVSGLLFEAQE